MAVELQLTLDSMIRAVEQAAPGDALGQLANASATATVLGELGDSLLGVFVDRCRRDGHSWSEIGGSLGVTKQAVQKRFVTVRTPLPLLFERFTGRARTVLERANDEARALEHNHRGTEHLLLALFDDADALAAIILAELAVTRGVVVERMLDEVPRGTGSPGGDLPLTPRSMRALELALSAALELGHNYIGTEHLLVGLLREGDGVAARVLNDLGVDDDRVVQRVVELLAGYQPT